MREVKGNFEDFGLTLLDRIDVIRKVNDESSLNENSYVSFSGGKDSVVLSQLIDMAIPGNTIPRVFINTGVEFNEMVKFIRKRSESDSRIVIINPKQSFKKTLEEFGYPFKSKEHSLYVSVYQRSGMTKTVERYLNREGKFACLDSLRYQFSPDFNVKLSDKCCLKNKKEVAHRYESESGRHIAITGMRLNEGGVRSSHKQEGCIFKNQDGTVRKFHPLFPVSDGFEEWLIKEQSIELCPLYYPPYSFSRTGCKGCPLAIDLQRELTLMERYFPSERKQCEFLWKPIYDEYRRLGYRLDKDEQLKLF